MPGGRRRAVRVHAAVALAAALVLAHAMPARADVRIGVFGPMTGEGAALGQSERQAIELAVKKKNAAGGVLGQRIEILIGDDGGKPELAVSEARRLARNGGAVVLLGGISSTTSFAASQIAAETRTPQIAIGAVAEKITAQDNPWVFRAALPEGKLAGNLADFIHEHFPERKKIAFIYVYNDFGRNGFDAFKLRAAQHGMEIVAEERYIGGDLDFSDQFAEIRSSGAQILVDWSRDADSARIQRQFVQSGMKIPRLGYGGQALPKFRELGGEAVNGMYYATHFSVATSGSFPGARAFIAEFRAAYGRDPDFVAAEAFDAAIAALLAIEAAGKPDRALVRDALRKVAFDGTRGRFAFDAKGDPMLTAQIVLLKDGRETDAHARH